MQESVSVIIISYHTGEVLFECINSALKLDYLKELILINNGNPVEVTAALQKLAENNNKIKLLTGHGNIGFAAACNLGFRQARGEYLFFLNPDCIVYNKNATAELINALKSDKNYKIATSLILNSDGTIQKTCRRNLLTPLIGISESLGLYRVFSSLEPLNLPISDIDKLPNISPIPALSGAVVFTSRDYYQKIEGFDEKYFLHVEDMDLCMKVHKLGDKIAFVKNITIVHLLSTSQTTNKFLEFHKAKGFILYMQKFFPVTKITIFKELLESLIWLRYFIKVYIFPKN